MNCNRIFAFCMIILLGIAHAAELPSFCSVLLEFSAALGPKSSASPFYTGSWAIIVPASASSITSWLLSWASNDQSSISSVTDFVFGTATASAHFVKFRDLNSSLSIQAVAVSGNSAIEPGQTLAFSWVGRRGRGGGTVAAPYRVQFQNIVCGSLQASGSDNQITCSPDSSSCSLSQVYCCISISNLSSAASDEWLAQWKQTNSAVDPDASPPNEIGKQIGIGLGISLGALACILVIMFLVARKRALHNSRLPSHHEAITDKDLVRLKRRKSQFRGDSCCDGEGNNGLPDPSDPKPSSTLVIMLTAVARRLSSCYCPYLNTNEQEGSQKSYLPTTPALLITSRTKALKRTRRRCHSCLGLFCNIQPMTALLKLVDTSEGSGDRSIHFKSSPRSSSCPSIQLLPLHDLLRLRHRVNDYMLDHPLVSHLMACRPDIHTCKAIQEDHSNLAPIEYGVDFTNDIRLGRLLGIGGFGRVSLGIWKGKEVAVKVCDIELADDLLEEAKLNAQVAGDRMVRVLAVAGLPPPSPTQPRGHLRAQSTLTNNIFQPRHHVSSSSGGSLSGINPGTINAPEPSSEIVPCEIDHDLEAPLPASRKVALVLELCEGGTLTEYTANRLPLSPLECLLILHDICLGLAHLHSQGVIHRDIKPQNLLIQKGRVKLGDLGLSRSMVQSHLTVTRRGGTPHYSAPESFLGSKLTPRADIYSLGMVAYELATGLPPWRELRSDKPDAVMFRIILAVAIKGQRPPIPPDLHPSLSALIIRAWSQDPNERPSAADMVEMIEFSIRSLTSSNTLLLQ